MDPVSLYASFRLAKKVIEDALQPQEAPEPKRVYFARNGEVIGEHSFQEACQMVRTSKVALTDHYWHEGMGEWKLVSECNTATEIPPAPPS